MSDESEGLEDRLVHAVRRAVEQSGQLIGGVQNRVEFHLHIDSEEAADAIAQLILQGAHELNIHMKPGRR